eukprot:scaffold147938_cov30-Tisochrysis_lutea.AAC.3
MPDEPGVRVVPGEGALPPPLIDNCPPSSAHTDLDPAHLARPLLEFKLGENPFRVKQSKGERGALVKPGATVAAAVAYAYGAATRLPDYQIKDTPPDYCLASPVPSPRLGREHAQRESTRKQAGPAGKADARGQGSGGDKRQAERLLPRTRTSSSQGLAAKGSQC